MSEVFMNKKRMKKNLRITLELLISIMLTLLIFYILNWYSFNTLPTKIVFTRMIIMILIIFDLIELFNYRKGKKYKELKYIHK